MPGPDTENDVSEDEQLTRHIGPPGAAVELSPGDSVGRYVIVERVAAGGMGTVYHAYDPRLTRRVALKLLRDGSLQADATGEQRLIREAQALAQLSSPNVVQIYEVGTAEIAGRGEVIFLAMEYADGKTLRAWWLDANPDWREVVCVLVAAGRGLLDAHAVGLVHRDFKPANVLVSADGRVRVVDFGLAKVAGDGLRASSHDEALRRMSRESDPDLLVPAQNTRGDPLTEHGMVVGTPAYMAPEQHEGEAGDERSDQYAFCLTLYEALYGARPFRATARKELLASKRAMDLRAVPTDRPVPPGLRKIVLRGMSPDPSQRWPTLAGLLQALEAFVGRRRRFLLAGGATVFVSVVSLGAFVRADEDPCVAVQAPMDVAWSEARRATLAAAFANTPSSTAVSTWARVEPQLDAYATEWRQTRRDACEAHRTGAQSSALMDRRVACLDEALRNVSGLLETFDVADMDIVVNADPAVRGLPRLARCADVGAMLADVAPPDDPQVARAVVQVREAVARSRARLEAGKLVEALDGATTAVAAAAAIDYLPVQAEALLLLGRAQVGVGEDAAAAASLDEAFRLALACGHDRVALLASLGEILVVGHKLGQPREALARRSLIEALLDRTDATASDRARAKEAVSSALRGARRLDEAQALLVEAIEIRRSEAADEPLALANVLNNYGNLLRDRERYDDSRVAFEESIALASEVLGPDHPTVASTLGNLASAEIDQGRGAEALPQAERAWRILRDALGPEHGETADALARLGSVRWLHGDREQAIADLGQAIAILERERGPEHRSTITALSNYGALLVYLERFDEARVPLLRALKVAEADEHGRNGAVAFLSQLLGQLEEGVGNRAQARLHCERAIAYIEEREGRDSTQLAGPLELLGEIAGLEGNVDEGVAHFLRGIAVAEGGLAAQTRGQLRLRLAQLLAQHERWAEAVAYLEQSEADYLAATAAGDQSPATAERLAAVQTTLADARAHLPLPTAPRTR